MNTANSTSRPIEHLLGVYAESHRHPKNELIHCVCVPAIVWSLLGLLWALHPLLALAVTVISLVYYWSLSRSLAIGMLIMSGLMLGLWSVLPPAFIWQIAVAVFIVAWIGQFIGHHIEKKKPSFFDDLRYLLIGPLFVLNILFRRLNIAI